MRKHLINRLPKRRGQSLVEMALFLMIILFVLGGAVNFGIGYFSYVAIRDAAQEGAIYASIHPPYDGAAETAIRYRVKNSASPYPVDLQALPASNISIVADEGTEAGRPISITVTYNYQLTLPFITLLIGTNSCGACIPLHATATGVILVNPPTP